VAKVFENWKNFPFWFKALIMKLNETFEKLPYVEEAQKFIRNWEILP